MPAIFLANVSGNIGLRASYAGLRLAARIKLDFIKDARVKPCTRGTFQTWTVDHGNSTKKDVIPPMYFLNSNK
jgi:hypothetical protein